MSFWYTPAKERLARGELIWQTHDIRVLLVMSNTTADTDQDAGTLSAITTLDECDGSGYARVALAGEAVVRDDANNRAELDCNDFVFPTLGAGTRSNVGLVVFRFVDGTAANDQPIAYIDSGGFPFNGNGQNVNGNVNAEGLLQVT